MAHEHHDVSTPGARRLVALIAVALGVATVAGMITLWPSREPNLGLRRLGLVSEIYQATVVSARRVPCLGTEAEIPANQVPCTRVRFHLDAGPDEGESRGQEFPVSATSPDLQAGDEVVLGYRANADPDFDYLYMDRQRRGTLLWLAVGFGVVVVLLGRWRGLAALAGLGASIAALLVFVLPALLNGESPVLVAIVGASAIAYLALYLAHGFQTMTSVALLGTLAALGLTVGLAALFTELAHLTGLASEDALLVLIGNSDLDFGALVLAGMVFGALGALDDVTVTQASAVSELRAANPSMSRFELYRSGVRIGRDHIASTVNTLALAYAGASLPLLILLVMSRQSLGAVANSEVIATEIIRTLVGSIGLVAAVPVTTWLAAALAPPVGESADSPAYALEHTETRGIPEPDSNSSDDSVDELETVDNGDILNDEQDAAALPIHHEPTSPESLEAEFWKRR